MRSARPSSSPASSGWTSRMRPRKPWPPARRSWRWPRHRCCGSKPPRPRWARAAAERAVPAAEQGVGAARSALEKARAERDELRRRHAAAELRRHLKPGAACPVCEQVVTAVPKGAAGGLDAVDAAVAKAETADRAAADALSHARVGLERARGEIAGLEKERAQLEAQWKDAAGS